MYVVGAAFDTASRSAPSPARRYSKKAEADLVPMVRCETVGLGSSQGRGSCRALHRGGPAYCRHSWPVRRSSSATSSCSSRILPSSRWTIVVMAGLTVFFGFTRTGKALRATSQNPRAAALIGIPVQSMRMIAWGLAAGLAGIAGILLSPKLLMTPDIGNVVMLAFAAAIIGGFSSLVGCVVGGIALGVLQILSSPDFAAGHGGHAVLHDHDDPGAASAGPVRRTGVQESLTMYGELPIGGRSRASPFCWRSASCCRSCCRNTFSTSATR